MLRVNRAGVRPRPQKDRVNMNRHTHRTARMLVGLLAAVTSLAAEEAGAQPTTSNGFTPRTLAANVGSGCRLVGLRAEFADLRGLPGRTPNSAGCEARDQISKGL